MAYFYIIFFALAILATGCMIATKVCDKECAIVNKTAKILAVVWMSLYFLNLFLPDYFAMRTFDNQVLFESGENIWFALLRWFNDVAFIVIPIAIFFKKDIFYKVAAYFCLAVCIINVACYFKYIEVYTTVPEGGVAGAGIMALRFFNQPTKDFFVNVTFRSIYFGVIFFMELMLLVFITIKHRKSFTVNKDKKSFWANVGVFAMLLVSIIPIYVPQYLSRGYALTTESTISNFKMGTFFHFVWMAVVVLEGIALTKIFKKKDFETKYIVMLVMSLCLIMQYHEMFTGIGEINAHRMPFQLCNMAGFFIILMLLTKNERIFHFAIVINSVGAIIAMVMCDTTPYGITYIMNIHYITEHTNVILIPILCATLGIFKPLQTKDIKDFIVGFTIYFVFVFIIGGIFTGLKETAPAEISDYWHCNYFYMFSKEETTAIVGFVAPLFDIKIKLFNFFTISLVQLVVYVAFLAICTGAFFLIKFLLNRNLTKKVKVENAIE